MQQFLNIRFVAPVITPGILIGSIVMGVGVTLLAGLLPARAASRITPLEALRPSVGEFSLRRMAGLGFWAGVAMIVLAIAALLSANPALVGLGGLVFVFGLILVAPALVNPVARLFGRLMALAFARGGTAHLAEGNLSRQPSRTAITASTTMIAIAVVVMGATLMSSLGTSFTDMLRKSLGSDYLLIPPSVSLWGSNVGASPALAEELRTVEGVAVVSTMRFAGTQINEAPVGLLGIEPRAYTETSGLTFSQGDPEAAYQAMAAGRAIVINGPLAATAGVQLGDDVALLTPSGQQNYRGVGIASDFLNAKTNTGYVSQANIEADFGRYEDVLIQINLLPAANTEAAEAAFKQALLPYPQFKLVAGQEYVDQNAGLLNSAFIGMYTMVIFLSIPSLIAMVNTLAIGDVASTLEISMLRAVGSTRRQVRTIILAEALILSAIGTAFGIAAGLYLGYLATLAIGAVAFPLDYHFPAAGVLVVIAAGLLFGALAAIIPARQASQMQIVQALRYE
jgi:putative ABC transport system permease protein